jgi:hypothetical protein
MSTMARPRVGPKQTVSIRLSLQDELLQALAGIDLAGIEVPL